MVVGSRRLVRSTKGMTLQATLISVWRQALVDGESEVLLGRRRYPTGFTRGERLRTVAFLYGRRRFFGIEQNPKTHSRWAVLARQGKRIMQFRYRNLYVANVCEGKVFRYPAWSTLKLPP
jgi:hypothetical protein